MGDEVGVAQDGAVTVLDCTIRDGSYAIDFKFTAADTALIAGLLDAAGLRYIEIGHGLGLGASEAGKGRAPSSDIDAIVRSRQRASRARLGAFFIPGIGTHEQLRAAASAGLDFVRVGNNADEIDTAWPVVEAARSVGLEVFVNLMKTYGISSAQFAEIAEEAEARGAAGVYVVDSAGGMLPGEVADYVERARERTALPIGFHGHSNLHLAVANSLAAIDAGARFIDTSVYGIGRSAGNVPTEVLAVVLDRLGIDTGLDPNAIIELAESYLRPLAEHLHPHDMTAVALGYGRFHSSYLPRALAAASDAGVSPLQLIVRLGQHDTMRLSDDLLRDTVEELRGTTPPIVHDDLASFSDERFGAARIGNRPTAVEELIDGLEVVASKRRLELILDLVTTAALDEDAVTGEFLLEDRFAAIGRVRAGSIPALAEAIRPHRERVGALLLDTTGLDTASVRDATRALGANDGGRIVVYRASELLATLVGDVAAALATVRQPVSAAVADPGWLAGEDVEALARRVGELAPVTRCGAELPADPHALCVVAGPVAMARPDSARAAWPCVVGLEPGPAPEWAAETVLLSPLDAYRDRTPGWLAALRAARPAPTGARIVA